MGGAGNTGKVTAKWDRSKGRPEPIRALNRIRERENGEPLVDIRDAAPSVRLVRATTIPYCRRSVAEMVERAARSLPAGIRLAVTDAWRPIERQRAIFAWMTSQLEEARPGLDPATKRRLVCRFVAPPDQKAPPGHCTGAALDVTLVDLEDEPLDLVSPYDRFMGAPTFVYGLTDQALANRSALVEAMLGVGFSNCRDEFWHYSYGDAGWAVRMGHDECVYGLAHLPPEAYAEQNRLWHEALKDRPNPFLPSGLAKGR
ncbi:MAG: hypothetical protein KIT11_11310 [Fimbriimonadaceae bacterium]|nr:hypothetical protein [Fimbriimonadaceae bacterium]QYK55380.1 MAG: hypothetical protein KF733_10225 [Fimbriimonadaceae bacterium]